MNRSTADETTPPQRHDCEEAVPICAGRGELHLERQIHRFGADTTLVVARNAAHQIISVGDASLELIGVFAV